MNIGDISGEKMDGINKRTYPLSFRTYLFIISIQVIFNILLYTWLLNGANSLEINLFSVFVGTFIAFPILSLFVGLILSLAPYKSLRYKEKYIPTTLLSFFFLNSIVTLGVLIALIRLVVTGSIYGK